MGTREVPLVHTHTQATNAAVADAASQLLSKWRAVATNTALVCAQDTRLCAKPGPLRSPARASMSVNLGLPMAMASAAEGRVAATRGTAPALAALDRLAVCVGDVLHGRVGMLAQFATDRNTC